ncbi:MAG: glycoside hydrolase family 20 zincin-like fold domain-containing protein [Armatimonadota bacterium]
MADVSSEQAVAWTDWLIPLPQEISIERAVTASPDDVGVRLRRDATDIERNAAAQLEALFEERTGAAPHGHGFRIIMGVCDEAGRVNDTKIIDPATLSDLPNSQQAYAIVPAGDNEIYLTALSPQGAFYAAMTMRQLLEATLTEDSVTIPLAKVRDWPDISERGEWGGSSVRDIEWMASHKMNLVEGHSQEHVHEDGSTTVDFDLERVETARLWGVHLIPIITHLDHLEKTGIYDVYPELRGVGDEAKLERHNFHAPCASNPKFREVLAGWMKDLASQDGIDTVSAWLSEAHVQCGCEECQKVGQFVLETQSLVDAWRQTREEYPNFDMRILLTQGSYETNDKVVAETPPEVGITYYHGGKTYDSSKDPMIYPLLEEYSEEGGWLGCYPQLTASWRIVCPWHGPQFIRYRMQEFVQKDLECLCGYATPDNRCYEFNVIAAAEWSWNSQGRDEYEFARAWATRKGFDDPEAAAQWAVMMGPVGWNLYGSRVPYNAFFGRAANIVRNRQTPRLGEGMYRYYPTLQALDDDITTCEWADDAARDFGSPRMAAEARAIGGMTRMLRAIHDLGSVLTEIDTPTHSQREKLNLGMYDLSMAAHDAVEGLRNWRDATEGWNGASRFDDTVRVIEQTAADIAKYLQKFGIQDALKPYREVQVGQWETEDFKDQRRITKTFDITDDLCGPGTCDVTFKYTSGYYGITSFSVKLLSAPTDDSENRREIAVDEHTGHASHTPRDNTYTLEVDSVEPDTRHFLEVDIRGLHHNEENPSRRGCNGNILMQRQGQVPDELPVPELEPMTPEQLAAFGPPQFQTDGVHVGVVPHGYGSQGIMEHLEAQSATEPKVLAAVTEAMLAPCDVVVVPQLRSSSGLGEASVDTLRKAVRDGLGLIVTHDAVGFRGQPVIFPEICAGGVQTSRQTHWVVAGNHPLVEGIAPDSRHGQSYYDQIQVEPGPDGVIIAWSADDNQPIGVVGEVGKGRYVALGLAIGLGADGDEVKPGTSEGRLLLNAVRWAAGQ